VEWFGDFGMWELTPFSLKDGLVHSRVCDDLVGCAAIVAMFRELAPHFGIPKHFTYEEPI
jgi:putative aminopeptidase FrvX